MSGAEPAGRKAVVGGSAGLASRANPITKLKYSTVMQ